MADQPTYDGDVPVDPGDDLQPLEAEWAAFRASPGNFEAAVALAAAADALVSVGMVGRGACGASDHSFAGAPAIERLRRARRPLLVLPPSLRQCAAIK